jgi:hypothetical protein
MTNPRKKPARPKPGSPEAPEELDRRVKEAVFAPLPAGATREQRERHRREAKQNYDAYLRTTGKPRIALGRELSKPEDESEYLSSEPQEAIDARASDETPFTRLAHARDLHESGETIESIVARSPTESPLAQVGRERKRAPDIPAGYLPTPGGGMIPAWSGDSRPSIRVNAPVQVLSAAIALRDLATRVILLRDSERADHGERTQLLAAYTAAFGRAAPNRPPWVSAFIGVLRAAKLELLQLEGTRKRSGAVAHELCFRPAQVKITRDGEDCTLEVLEPRGTPTIQVANRQVKKLMTKRPGAKVIAEIDGYAPEAAVERLRKEVPGTVVVRTVERERLAIRRRELDRDDDALEVVPESKLFDDDVGARLVTGPPVVKWQRIAKEDSEDVLWVALTMEQAIRYRQLTPPDALNRIRVAAPAWDPVPAYANDDEVVAWLTVKLGMGRGGGRNAGLSAAAIIDLLTKPQDLVAAIERDAAAGRTSADQKERLLKVARGIRDRAPQMFGRPERPTPGPIQNR